MNEEVMRREMAKMNINFDLAVIEKVGGFLRAYYSRNPIEKPSYEVAAATAIICQTIVMPTVNSRRTTGSGIKIENIMRSLGCLSKEEFLNILQIMAEKGGQEYHILLERVAKINLSFRIFKKYKEMFQKLTTMTSISPNIFEQLMSFYWIMYLLIKKYMKVANDANESALILASVLQELFCQRYGRLKIQMFWEVFHEQSFFPYGKMPEQAFKKQVINYSDYLTNEIELNRGQEGYFSIGKITEKQLILPRFIDDINEIYIQEQKELQPSHFIDEVTFLELSKNLTPLIVFSRKPRKIVSKKITFSSEEEEGEEMENQSKLSEFLEYYESGSKSENPSIKSPNLGKISQLEKNQDCNPVSDSKDEKKIIPYTPVSKSINKNLWVSQFLDQIQVKEFEHEISKWLEGEDFESTKKEILKKISEQISLMPKNSEPHNQQQQIIWKLFIGMLTFLMPINKYISLKELINPLACLCGCLENHALRSINILLSKYCKIYGVNIFDVLLAIYEVHKLDLPRSIEDYLLDLEKKAFIEQIWENEEGYQFLVKRNCKPKCEDKIYLRFEKNLYLRIQEICFTFSSQSSFVREVQQLMKKILHFFPYMLLGNSLDPMIICAILAILSQNVEKNERVIGIIFSKYSQNIFQPHQTSAVSIIERQEQKMTLSNYYNQVFLIEIKKLEEDPQKQSQSDYQMLKEEDFVNKKLLFGVPDFPPVSKFATPNPFENTAEKMFFKASRPSQILIQQENRSKYFTKGFLKVHQRAQEDASHQKSEDFSDQSAKKRRRGQKQQQ